MDASLAALIILVGTILLNAVSWLAQRSKLQLTDAAKGTLVRDISELRKEAAKYNTPSTYAKCAKCQRLIGVKEKQLAGLESSPQAYTWQDRVQRAAYRCKLASAALCTLLFYGKPLVHVLPEILTPMQRMLSMPHGKAFSQFGAVAVLPWMLVCDRAGSMLVQAVFPARRRPLPPPSRTAAGSEAELQAEAPSAEAKKAQ